MPGRDGRSERDATATRCLGRRKKVLAKPKSLRYNKRAMTTKTFTPAAPDTRTCCPCCGKGVKVSKAGKYSRHGYKDTNGIRWNGGCPLSAVLATNTVEVMLLASENQLAHLQENPGDTTMEKRRASAQEVNVRAALKRWQAA